MLALVTFLQGCAVTQTMSGWLVVHPAVAYGCWCRDTKFPRRLGVSGGGSSSMEQFATSDKSRQLTAAVSERDKSTSFPTVILWLIGSHCCVSRTADSLTLQRSTHVLHQFCKVTLQRHWCNSVTLIFAFLIIIIIILLVVCIVDVVGVVRVMRDALNVVLVAIVPVRTWSLLVNSLTESWWVSYVSIPLIFCTPLFVSISQVIGCEDRLQNDLYCVGWGVKLYSTKRACMWV